MCVCDFETTAAKAATNKQQYNDNVRLLESTSSELLPGVPETRTKHITYLVLVDENGRLRPHGLEDFVGPCFERISLLTGFDEN